jgi:3-oxoacyl-[acyl-carrier-protein] synthase-3
MNIHIMSLANQLGSRVKLLDVDLQFMAGTTKLFSFSPDEDVVEIACRLAERILNQHNIALSQISGVFGSSNASFETLLPTLTTVFASRLGLRKVIADHIGLGCAGGVQSLRNCYNQLCVDFMQGKQDSYYLVIVGDQTNRILDETNRRTNLLFSEAVSVLLVTNDQLVDSGYRINRIGTKSLLTNLDVMRINNPYCTNQIEKFEMDGKRVFRFAVESFPDILSTVDMNHFGKDKFYFIPHQANLRIINSLIEREGLDKDLVYNRGIQNYGNTSGSAVFCGLEDALRQNLFDKDLEILLGAFGAELQVGGVCLSQLNLEKFLLTGGQDGLPQD